MTVSRLIISSLSIVVLHASDTKCTCAKYPFTPEPPCVEQCAAAMLIVADQKTLIEIFQFSKSDAARIINEQPHLRKRACDKSEFVVGGAKPDYTRVYDDVTKLLGKDKVKAFENSLRPGKELPRLPHRELDTHQELNASGLTSTLQKLGGRKRNLCSPDSDNELNH